MTGREKDELRVTKVERENQDVTSLYLEGPEIQRFKGRTPGQFAAIRVMLPDGSWSRPHPFTISCAPEDEKLRLTIKNVGGFTSTVPELAPGTPVQCSGPYGAFCSDIAKKSDIVMIAGGVGITPFLSVLRHFERTGAKNRVLLFWANKTLRDAFAAEELAGMTKALDLTVVHVLSRQAPPKRDEGRVRYEQGHLNRELLKKYGDRPGISHYLCGPPAMQDAVLEELSSCGVDPAKVSREAFTFQPKPL